MNELFEWPILWVFPIHLIILAFLLALIALIDWRKQRFSAPMLAVLASAVILCFAVGVYCIIKMYIIADEKCTKLHVQNAHFCRAF